ncbi:unnamed protein product [Larinioides sclopetarius]|uniref:glutathione transferase n=1 Tax=Larinioides sclopetarius TaxID=280406 RepID=A0AAV1ZTY7_9ARAC
MAKPILGYWDCRGVAEPIRYLLHYKKIDFEDKRYTTDGAGCEIWKKEKFNLGLDFPNLPYFIDGDLKITQSITIMRYLGHKHGLSYNSKEQQVRTMVAEQQSVEFRQKLNSFTLGYECEIAGKNEFLESVQPMFQQWENFLGNRQFVAGDNLTYVDFMVYEVLDLYRELQEKILDDYQSLKVYFNSIKKLPELQEYLNSPTHLSQPSFK